MQTEKNIGDIHGMTSRYRILSVDEFTALMYGEIKAALRKKGRPIPENDTCIAAIALQYDLTLASRDKHFDEIDGIKIARG